MIRYLKQYNPITVSNFVSCLPIGTQVEVLAPVTVVDNIVIDTPGEMVTIFCGRVEDLEDGDIGSCSVSVGGIILDISKFAIEDIERGSDGQSTVIKLEPYEVQRFVNPLYVQLVNKQGTDEMEAARAKVDGPNKIPF